MPCRPLQLLVSTWHGCYTGSVGPSLCTFDVGVSMGRKEVSFGWIPEVYVCLRYWSGLGFS